MTSSSPSSACARRARRSTRRAATRSLSRARNASLVGHPVPLKESIKRLTKFAEAGADCLYARPGPRKREDIVAIVKAVAPKPVNVLVGGPVGLTVADLADLGVRRISVGGALARVAWGAFHRVPPAISPMVASTASPARQHSPTSTGSSTATWADEAICDGRQRHVRRGEARSGRSSMNARRSDRARYRLAGNFCRIGSSTRSATPERSGRRCATTTACGPIWATAPSPTARPSPTGSTSEPLSRPLFLRGRRLGERSGGRHRHADGDPPGDARDRDRQHRLFARLAAVADGDRGAISAGALCLRGLGYRRYEWKCNALNAPSMRAAERLGFTYEGTFRQHMIVKGRNRDTAWFSMLDGEWPARKPAFERWLAPANFNAKGQQRQTRSRVTAATYEEERRNESTEGQARVPDGRRRRHRAGDRARLRRRRARGDRHRPQGRADRRPEGAGRCRDPHARRARHRRRQGARRQGRAGRHPLQLRRLRPSRHGAHHVRRRLGLLLRHQRQVDAPDDRRLPCRGC